jgi:hypothetical protein
LSITVVALIVIGLRRAGPLDATTKILYLAAGIAALIVFGSIVSDIYTTWAQFSVSLSEKKNVVVKPVELLLLVTWLALIALFADIFVTSADSPQVLIGSALFFVVVAALLISSYRQTVSRTIVNPIDVAPITIDPGETIAISIGGVTLMGGGLLQKVGFGRQLSQQYYTPASGRKLNPWGQNALLVSETRLYFIFVPIGLGDQESSGAAALESVFSGSQIRAKLDDMLASMSLQQIYESNPINFALELTDVRRVDVLKRAGTREYIAFVDKNGDKIRALFDISPGFDEFEALMQRTLTKG